MRVGMFDSKKNNNSKQIVIFKVRKCIWLWIDMYFNWINNSQKESFEEEKIKRGVCIFLFVTEGFVIEG